MWQSVIFPQQSDILETETKTAIPIAKLVFYSDLASVNHRNNIETFVRQQVY